MPTATGLKGHDAYIRGLTPGIDNVPVLAELKLFLVVVLMLITVS